MRFYDRTESVNVTFWDPIPADFARGRSNVSDHGKGIQLGANSPLAGLSVLVTGGCGFIGSELVRQLANQECKVRVLDNFSSGKLLYLPPDKGHIEVIKGDIREERTVSRAVKGVDVVYHLAALPFIPDSYRQPWEFFDTNVMATLTLLLRSNAEGVRRFVYVSSSEIYGSALHVPMDESHPTNPHSTYAVSKLAADRMVFTFQKENRLPTVIIRPFNCYGPRVTQPYIIPEIITQSLNNSKTIKLGNLGSTRDFTYVEDTARAISAAGVRESAVGETINVGSGNETSIEELAQMVLKILGKHKALRPERSRMRPYDVERLVCDNRKASRLLGWTPRIGLRQGIALTIKWFATNSVAFRGPFVKWYETDSARR